VEKNTEQQQQDIASPLKLNRRTEGRQSTRWNSAAFFMICLMLIFSSVAYGAVDTWAFGFLSIFAGLIIIFWIIDGWKNKELIINTNLILIPLVGIILVGFIQLLPLGSLNFSNELLSIPATNTLSLDPYSTKIAIVKFFIFLVVFWASLTFINTPKRLSKIVFTIIIFAGLMAFYGILQNLTGTDTIYGLRPAAHASPFAAYVNKHHFAAFMEMTIGLTLGILFIQGTKKDKFLLLIIAVVLMGIAIVMTGSRGGFLSLVGVLGFLVLMTVVYGDKKQSDEKITFLNKKNIAVIGGSILLILVLFSITIWLGAGESLERGVGMQVADTDFSTGRTHFWSTTLQIILNNPILGTGLDAYGVSFPQYDTWNGMYRLEYAHNDYLQTLSDSGIIGFALLILFIFLLFKQTLNVIRTSNDRFRRGTAIGALAGCFGILIHSLFDFPLRTNANSLFFLVLAAIAVTSIKYPKIIRRRVKMKKIKRKEFAEIPEDGI
jgi:O-antigen ligase